MVSAIEHVGSTSVPGLAAKPIIDLDVLLASAAYLPETIRRLATLGHEHQGDLGIAGREAFRAPPTLFAHHLYVCLPNCEEFRTANILDGECYPDKERPQATALRSSVLQHDPA